MKKRTRDAIRTKNAERRSQEPRSLDEHELEQTRGGLATPPGEQDQHNETLVRAGSVDRRASANAKSSWRRSNR